MTTRSSILTLRARQLPQIPFRVIGWGERMGSLKRNAPVNVSVEEFARNDSFFDALATSPVFLFPSRAETFGLAVAEAMASGCAIVSSVPLEFAGIHIDTQDLPGIVRAVQSLWQDRETAAQFGAENVRRAQQFSWSRHINTLWQVYESVLNRRANP